MGLTTPLNISANYYGGYVQDDWRVSSKLTLNYGLRIEHEDGIQEMDNNITVGFDRTAAGSLSSIVIPASVDPTGGTAARSVVGGLMYAGVNGNHTYQGNPPKAKWSPRIGTVYSLTSKTVLRGGYGLYWAPWNYPAPSPTQLRRGSATRTAPPCRRRPARPRCRSPIRSRTASCGRPATHSARRRASAPASTSSIRTAPRRACSRVPGRTCSASSAAASR